MVIKKIIMRLCIKIPINKIDEINKIKPIFFLKKNDFPKNIKNKPIKITKNYDEIM